MIQKEFAERAISVLRKDPDIVGLAVAGSWISNDLDEYSDLDLVLVTKNKIAGDKEKMIAHAKRLGNFISGFTGEHVGEPRLLVCLFDEPLLHVDIKFITPEEFHDRVEDPVILFERDQELTNIITKTKAHWPQPDLQWIEDRFWTWVHYIAGKAARGEYFECIDGLGFLRAKVLAPMIQVRNKDLARGLRKVESKFSTDDLNSLRKTLSGHNKTGILAALKETIQFYRSLRDSTNTGSLVRLEAAENAAIKYLDKI